VVEKQFKFRMKRTGIFNLEFLVSFSIIATVMMFATSMTLNINRLWKDIRLQRLAVCELSNQLEVLTKFDGRALQQRIDAIEPSEFCQQGLHEPRITATVVNDDLGQRIDLELTWKHRPVDQSIRLSGWAVGAALARNRLEDQGAMP
jgi:hypothetical protein